MNTRYAHANKDRLSNAVLRMRPMHLKMVSAIMVLIILMVTGCSEVAQKAEAQQLIPENSSENDFFGSSMALSGNRVIIGALSADLNAKNGGAAYIYEFKGDTAWVDVAALSPAYPDMNFGYDVSLSGDRALIGAPLNNNSGLAKPSARIYEKQADGQWVETAVIRTPENTFSKNFATSVSLSGDRALIAAPIQWVHWVPEAEANPNPGVVYVFEREEDGEWVEAKRLMASDADQDDRFGSNLALSGDRAIIGAWGDDENGEDAGAAYIFERQADGSWVEITKIAPAGSGARFGSSVAMSGDRVLIGAPWDFYEGRAFIFERTASGDWEEIALLEPTGGNPDGFRAANIRFGSAVSLAGDRALVGSPFHGNEDETEGTAYLFELRENNTWEPTKFKAPDIKYSARYGGEVALSGEHILIGAPAAKNDNEIATGATYMFRQ